MLQKRTATVGRAARKKISKLMRRHARRADGSCITGVPCYCGFNGGLLNVNVIVPILIICLLVLSAVLISGCSGNKGEDNGDKSTSSIEEGSTDAGDENNADDKDQAAPSDANSQPQDELVEQVAVNYAMQMNPAIPGLNVIRTKITGQWACVDVEPSDRSAEKARVLLKNNAGQWQVIAFGYVLPEDYPDAPAELFE